MESTLYSCHRTLHFGRSARGPSRNKTFSRRHYVYTTRPVTGRSLRRENFFLTFVTESVYTDKIILGQHVHTLVSAAFLNAAQLIRSIRTISLFPAQSNSVYKCLGITQHVYPLKIPPSRVCNFGVTLF